MKSHVCTRLLAFLLSVVMVVGMVPVAAFASETGLEDQRVPTETVLSETVPETSEEETVAETTEEESVPETTEEETVPETTEEETVPETTEEETVPETTEEETVPETTEEETVPETTEEETVPETTEEETVPETTEEETIPEAFEDDLSFNVELPSDFALFGSGVNYDETVDDYYKVVSNQEWDIAPGITEAEIVLNNDAGNRKQVLHVMKADMTNPYAQVITSYKEMNFEKFGTSTMVEQTDWIQENMEGTVVGAMNTTLSWYTGATYTQDPSQVGRPLAYTMLNGNLKWDICEGFPSVLIINKDEKDGAARPADMPKVQIRNVESKDDLNGWEEQIIPGGWGLIIENGKNKYTEAHNDPAPRSVVAITDNDEILIMMNDGRQEPYSTGMCMYELGQALLSMGCTYAFNCDGGGSSQFLSKRPGEDLEVNCSPSDGALRPTTQGIVFISLAPADGSFAKADISTEHQYYTPGTAVQFRAVATDYVGNPAELPADVIWECDTDFGTIDSNGLFTSNGKVGEVQVQMLHNGEVVGRASVHIVKPEIAFTQEKLVLPYGKASPIEMKVTTGEGLIDVTTKAGDIVFTLSDAAMGTIEGSVFTTTEDRNVTGGTLTATFQGDTEKAVSVPVQFGQASQIVYDFEEGFELIMDNSNDGGTDASGDTPANYHYGWHIASINRDQYFAYRWSGTKANRSPIGLGVKCGLRVVDETTGKVRNGKGALAVDIDWTGVTSMGAKQFNIWFPEPIDVSEASNFGMWLYVPDYANKVQTAGSFTFRLVGYNKDGGTSNLNVNFDALLQNCGFNDEGWYYVNYDVLNLNTVEYFHIYATDQKGDYNSMPDTTFYVDDVTIDYSNAVIDRENPYFTSLGLSNGQDGSTALNGQTIGSGTVSIMAQAKENTAKSNATGLNTKSAKIYVDGMEVSGVTCTASGAVAANVSLTDGPHTIRVEIKDKQGNLGSSTGKIVVKTEKADVRLEPADPNYAELPAGSLMYFNLVAEDISKIQSVTTRINLDGVNEWELDHMTTAYGFTSAYSVDDNNDAFITITRKDGDINEDTNILAQLPVRIWMTKSYLDPDYIAAGYVSNDTAKQDKGYALTPYAMWMTDGVFKIKVIADASEGSVTYTDGSHKLFSSPEFRITTELNRYRNSKNDGDANFYQNKSSFHIHKAGAPADKAATCLESGYTGRVFCEGCSCVTPEKLGHECDTSEGCGSVITWGKTVPAAGHSYGFVDGVLKCTTEGCGVLFNGEYTDGKTYVDGKVQDGWYGNSYYRDGVKLTGINVIDGVAYDLGTGSTKQLFTGFYKDDVGYRYYAAGDMRKGFVTMADGGYYFDDRTGYAPVGSFQLGGRTYKVEGEMGKVLGAWDVSEAGKRYYYSLRYYKNTWLDVDGDRYYFNNEGYAATGKTVLTHMGEYLGAYEFDADGKYQGPVTGILPSEDGTYLHAAVDGVLACDKLVKIGDDYYYARPNYYLITWPTYLTSEQTGGLLPAGEYSFGEDGKMLLLNGPVADKYTPEYLYFYQNGVRVDKEGLYQFEGDYYYVRSNGLLLTWSMHITKTNGLLPAGEYSFGPDGKLQMLNGPVKDAYSEQYWNFYKDGIRVYEEGLYEFEGDYYYVRSNGLLLTWNMNITKTNGLLPAGEYSFGPDGKLLMLNGPVKDAYNEKYWNFYKDGIRVYEEGLYQYENDYYYVRSNGLLLTWNMNVTKTNGLLPAGEYSFGPDGKLLMLNGPVKDAYNDQYWNFYKDGIRVYEEGLYEYEGDYYYVRSNGLLLTWNMNITKTNGLLPAGEYSFGPDGKLLMLNGPVADKFNDQYLTFYKDGIRVYEEGLYEYEGDYYYVRSNGLLLTWSMYITKTNGLVEEGEYTFGADGKMIQSAVAAFAYKAFSFIA